MYKLGIDLGGTNIVAGVVDENYKIIGIGKRKTNAGRGPQEIVSDMAAAAFEAAENAGVKFDEIEHFGVGTPGSVDVENGIVCFCNNLGFYDFPLSQMLFESTGKRFYIANDAGAAAYGEYIAGAGRGCKNFVVVTLGTGVGGGIIIDGKIYSGSNGAGGEIGHTVIQMNGQMCNCGREGCFEAYASATALIRQTKQAMHRFEDSKMWEITGGDISKVSGITAFKAKKLGDKAASNVVNQYIRYLAAGVANVLNIFQPDIICIGGGISHEGDALIEPLNEIILGEDYARNMEHRAIIKAADLGNDAGIIGAAYLCNLYK